MHLPLNEKENKIQRSTVHMGLLCNAMDESFSTQHPIKDGVIKTLIMNGTERNLENFNYYSTSSYHRINGRPTDL